MNRAADVKYSGFAMLLHWLIAGLVIAQWLISISAEDAPTRAEGSAIMANHFALGVVIFVVVAVRLVWRQVSPPPPGGSGRSRGLSTCPSMQFCW